MIDHATYELIKLNPEEFNARISRDVTIGDSDVLPKMQEQVQLYMFWGEAHARAEAEARKANYEFKDEVMGELRNRGRIEMHGKPTVQALADWCCAQPQYKTARNKMIQAEEFAARCKHAVEAMRQRLHMIQSINSRQKSELNSISR